MFEYVDSEHPTLGLDNLLQELERRNKVPSDNLSVVVCFWGVRQLDIPSFTEYETPNTIQLLSESIQRSDEEGRVTSTVPDKRFDMNEIDTTINEIEDFISDIDEKF